MNKKHIIILIILTYFFFIFGNGILSLTNPDEVFYAQTAKEMVRQNSWMTPYIFAEPQFEKPILLYWLLRLGFILFGINSFSARFFPAIFAAIGVLCLYFLALLGFKNDKKAFLAGLAIMSSGLYIGLARTLFTDLIFAVFIILALTAFYWGYTIERRKALGLLLFFIFMALAVLTKGPLGLLIPFLSVVAFLFCVRDIKFLFSRYSLLGLFIFSLIALPWYVLMIKLYGSTFTHEFFYNDHYRRLIEAEHAMNDTWYFYPGSMIACMFPWSLFVAASLFSLPKRIAEKTKPVYIFLASFICVTFFIFQVAHSKLVSYIFPVFPALALLAADFIYERACSGHKSRSLFFLFLATAVILFLIAIGVIPSLRLAAQYLSCVTPLYYFIGLMLILAISTLALLLKNQFLKASYALVFVLPVFLGAIPFIRGDIEPYLSSKDACEYLLNNYDVKNTIICSKFYVRGVRYYTDRPVAVIDIPGKPFFSPHAVTFLNEDSLVRNFVISHLPVYCILKKSSVEDVDRICRIYAKELKYTLLKAIGNEYIVRIEALP